MQQLILGSGTELESIDELLRAGKNRKFDTELALSEIEAIAKKYAGKKRDTSILLRSR